MSRSGRDHKRKKHPEVVDDDIEHREKTQNSTEHGKRIGMNVSYIR